LDGGKPLAVKMSQINTQHHELENIIGVSGDLKLKRVCDSKTCMGQRRLFNRVGLSTFKRSWAYTCERCDNYYYLQVKSQERTAVR